MQTTIDLTNWGKDLVFWGKRVNQCWFTGLTSTDLVDEKSEISDDTARCYTSRAIAFTITRRIDLH